MIASEEPIFYKHKKVNLKSNVRKWNWTSFKNPARTDSAELSHWQCANEDPNKLYPFAKFNRKINLIKYSEDEYNKYLLDNSWSKAETDHLIDLCDRYDLRFYIINDRWDSNEYPHLKPRSIDELKDRYYKVNGIMQRIKQGDDAKVFVFDLEHEQKRREQLEKLFNRTKDQVDEENYLLDELKKIEIRKKERERKQMDVNKLLTAVVDLESTNTVTLPSLQASNLFKHRNSLETQSPSLNNKRVKQRKISTQSNNETKNVINLNVNSNSNSLNNSTEALPISPASSTQNMETRNKKSLIFKVILKSSSSKNPQFCQKKMKIQTFLYLNIFLSLICFS